MCDSPAASAAKTSANGTSRPSTRDRDAEVEPVALAGDLRGRDADRQRLADVAVVGRLARRPRRRSRRRAARRGSSSVVKRMAVEPGERIAAVAAGRPAVVEQAEALEAGPVRSGLARGCARSAARSRKPGPLRRSERDASRLSPDPVDHSQPSSTAWPGAVAGVQDERGRRDLGRRERRVRGDHRRDAARAPGQISSAKRSSVGGRDRRALARRARAAAAAAAPAARAHEPQRGSDRRSVGRLGAHDAVAVAPRKSTGSSRPVGRRRRSAPRRASRRRPRGSRRATTSPRIVAASSPCRAVVDERQPEAGASSSSGQRWASAVAQVDRLVAAVAVPVGQPALRRRAEWRAARGASGEVVGAVLAVADVPPVEPPRSASR